MEFHGHGHCFLWYYELTHDIGGVIIVMRFDIRSNICMKTTTFNCVTKTVSIILFRSESVDQ